MHDFVKCTTLRCFNQDPTRPWQGRDETYLDRSWLVSKHSCRRDQKWVSAPLLSSYCVSHEVFFPKVGDDDKVASSPTPSPMVTRKRKMTPTPTVETKRLKKVTSFSRKIRMAHNLSNEASSRSSQCSKPRIDLFSRPGNQNDASDRDKVLSFFNLAGSRFLVFFGNLNN